MKVTPSHEAQDRCGGLVKASFSIPLGRIGFLLMYATLTFSFDYFIGSVAFFTYFKPRSHVQYDTSSRYRTKVIQTRLRISDVTILRRIVAYLSCCDRLLN